jgi:nucleotide-binding universal stress UspA family protein
LLVYDEDGGVSTLRLARQLIERTNARATLLAVTGDVDSIERVRAASLQRLRSAGLSQMELQVRVGEPAEQIAIEQMESLYSMVLVAPRAALSGYGTGDEAERPRLRRLGRLDPMLLRILEQAHTPVLFARQAREKLARMLICTAVGEPGKNDVRVGGRLARRLGAAVTLLYVTRNSNDPGRLVHDHLDRAASTLRTLDVPVEVRIRPAPLPAKGILAEALDGNHDLIVVGRHGPQSRSVFGRDDVTLQVLTGANRPVLIIPSDDLS